MRSATNIVVLLSLLMATELRAAADDRPTDDSPDVAILRQQGAEPDRESASKVLRDLQPSDKQRERIAALITQLGSDEYPLAAIPTCKAAGADGANQPGCQGLRPELGRRG